MKILRRLIWLAMVTVVPMLGSTLSDVKILESSEQIKRLVQQIAKDYTLLYLNKSQEGYHDKAINHMREMEDAMRSIAFATKNPKIKRILDFFAYESEQIKEHIDQHPTPSRVLAVLDSSEALTEGAAKIVALTRYDANPEERMFMRCRRIIYLMQKASKYYTLLCTDLDKTTIPKKLKQTIKQVDREIDAINNYTYTNQLGGFMDKKEELNAMWRFNKRYYLNVSKVRMPLVLELSTKDMDDIVNTISAYHSKN